jgi:hypothetical protein
VSRSILHLVSESGRYITGHTMVVDCGSTTVAFGNGVTVSTMMADGGN